jgi:hypothetical protein
MNARPMPRRSTRVGEEPLVLDPGDGIDCPRRNLVVLQQDPVAVVDPDELALVVVEDRVLGVARLVGGREHLTSGRRPSSSNTVEISAMNAAE